MKPEWVVYAFAGLYFWMGIDQSMIFRESKETAYLVGSMVYNSLAVLAFIVGSVVTSQGKRIKELEERLGITTQAGQSAEQATRQARESLLGGLPVLLGLLAGWLLIGGEWGMLAGALGGVLVAIVASAVLYVMRTKNSNSRFGGIDKRPVPQ